MRLPALVALALAWPLPGLAQQWQAGPTPAAAGTPLRWQPTEPANAPVPTPEAVPELEPPRLLSWEPVPEAEVIPADAVAAPPAPLHNPAVALAALPSGPTFANFRALWRDGDWLPQISNTVPVGFGPQGVMATLEYRAIDCITGAGYCSVPDNFQAWKDQISVSGDAFFDTSIGFGDSLKAVGVVLSVVSENTNTPLLGRSGSEGEVIFGNANLGIHLTRHLGSDTAVRLGIDNLFRQDCYNGACGLPQNAYGVVSQRFRLNPNQDHWFANAYLTLGAGNGAFRSLAEQVQSSIAAQRAAGCSTYGYSPKKDCSEGTRRRAVYDAASFGDLTPIGALGLEMFKGFHLIGEWSGRNLNAGLSFRPFPELGFVITPMWENLLPNCDYGCRVSVPDYPGGAPIPSNLLTERARFSIQASVEVKF